VTVPARMEKVQPRRDSRAEVPGAGMPSRQAGRGLHDDRGRAPGPRSGAACQIGSWLPICDAGVVFGRGAQRPGPGSLAADRVARIAAARPRCGGQMGRQRPISRTSVRRSSIPDLCSAIQNNVSLCGMLSGIFSRVRVSNRGPFFVGRLGTSAHNETRELSFIHRPVGRFHRFHRFGDKPYYSLRTTFSQPRSGHRKGAHI
jgi:hypothetical protein